MAFSPETDRIALVRQPLYLAKDVTPSPLPDEAKLVDSSCLGDNP